MLHLCAVCRLDDNHLALWSFVALSEVSLSCSKTRATSQLLPAAVAHCHTSERMKVQESEEESGVSGAEGYTTY